jgi:lipoprotein-anchoring transpeptidase ErfK/SrfK
MEVLLKRNSRKRASRALIGVLGCTIIVGGVFYFYNSKSTPATAQAAEADAPKPAEQPVVVKKVEPAVTPIAKTTTPTELDHPTTAPAGQATNSPYEPGSERRPFDSGPPMTGTQLAAAPTSPTFAAPSGPVPTLSQAKSMADAGQILKARNAYNEALVSGKLSPADEKAAKAAIAEISKTLVFSPRRFPEDALQTTYVVKSGDRMAKIADQFDIPWELLCKINNLSDPRKMRAGQTLKIIKGPFHAVVTKSAFTLDIYLGAPGGPGSTYVTTFGVGLGKDDSTPTGTWEVKPQSKLRNPTYYSTLEEGPRIIAADDPKNPLGEYWLGLTGVDGHAVGKESYGIHGTIEPDSIGKMSSLGCIRMLNENVAQVFDMLVETKSHVVVR